MKKDIVKIITSPIPYEQEFACEQEIRNILQMTDLNELRALSALLMKQNSCQAHVILESLTKISQLEKRVKTLQSRVTTLIKAKFPLFQPLKSILNRSH